MSSSVCATISRFFFGLLLEWDPHLALCVICCATELLLEISFVPREVLVVFHWSVSSLCHVLAMSQCLHEAVSFGLRSERQVSVICLVCGAADLSYPISECPFIGHFIDKLLGLSSRDSVGNPWLLLVCISPCPFAPRLFEFVLSLFKPCEINR